MEHTCQAYHCDNVIRGRRKDAKYCSESCKQVNKRYRQENGIIGSTPKKRYTPIHIEPSGSLINDVAGSGAIALMHNGAADPVAAISGNMLRSCVPYAIEAIKKNPVRSLLFALGGFKVAASVFKTCTTTITKGKTGKDVTSKTCKPASAIHKTGSAAAAVIGGNYLLDQLIGSYSDHMATSDTGNTRVRPGSNPSNSVVDSVVNNLDLSFSKAN